MQGRTTKIISSGCATANNTDNPSAVLSVAPSSFFKPVCHPLPTDLGGGTSAVLDDKTVGNNDNNDNKNVKFEENNDNNKYNYGNLNEIELNRIESN